MKDTIKKLQQLLDSGTKYISNASDTELGPKPDPEKWSKKEIIGHLIDSAVNNLQRFTEIQFEDKPYKIRKYNQDELVKANNYQNADTEEILGCWLGLNKRIKSLIEQQTEETLQFRIELGDDKTSDLRFLMTDYVDHLEHHLKQIMK